MNRSYINTASFAAFLSKKTKLGLNNSKIFTILLIMLAFCGKMEAQTLPTIIGDEYSSDLTCSSFTGITIVYIGDGVTDSKLIMDSNLNLTTCGLEPIQLVIRNKGILEFSAGNYNLNLPTGSSVVIESGGNITTLGSCSNSDLIQIGGNSVATCQGGGMPSFDDVVENGGINEAGILSGNQYICSIPGSTTFISSESGGTFTFTSGTPSVATVNSSGVITAVAVGQSVITYTKNSKSTTRIVYVGSSFGGTVSGGTTLCSTTNSTILTLSGYKGTIVRWESSTNNFSNSTTISNTTNTLTVTNLTNTTSYRAVINGTGCTANSASTTIIVGTNLSASVSIVASPSGTICSGTSVTFTATPINGGTTPSYQWKLNGVNVGTNTATYTNTALSNNDLVTCVMTSNATPCLTGSPATSNTVTMEVSTTNTWTGSTNASWFTASNWSCGVVPIITSDVIIPDVSNKPVIDGVNTTAIANTLTVDLWSSLTILSGNTLKITDKLTNNNGTITFLNDASLVQTNNVVNSGDIEYNRDTTSRNSDYTYWSSPVSSSQPLGGALGLFPDSLNGTFYSFDSSINPANWKNESSATSMTVGKGYIARGPENSGNQTPPNTPFTTTFNGVPNNGTINVPILHSGASDGTSNLIGNPYPSAIDANTFLSANSTVIEGTIYFWTHNTAIGAGTIELGPELYPYTAADYASYNSTGGTAGSSGEIPNGKIAAGQGFFVTSLLASGNAKFENNMRITGNNSQFFKKRNSKTEKSIEKNRIWLNFTNTQGAFKQTLVGYITGATNDYDDRFDGESFDGNEFVDFYSLNQDKNLVIQGRALPFDENDEIPLGYRSTINGDFTINIDQTDGLLTNQAVFLEDKLTQMVFDLKSGNYTFNTVAGTFNDRFVLRYKDNSTAKTLGKPTVDTIENKVLVSNKNKQIKINSNSETIDKVMVYDVSGKLMYKKEKANSQEVIITNLTAKNQVLIVKTTLQNGKTVTDKIVN
jgi:hypothetical protein